jgi:hypothetical protein
VLWGFVTFAASFVALGVWDLVLIYRGKLTGNSASRVILEIAQAHPGWVFFVAFALGVLVGHFLLFQTVKA